MLAIIGLNTLWADALGQDLFLWELKYVSSSHLLVCYPCPLVPKKAVDHNAKRIL
jgi:hypothetical protein